MAMAIQAQYPSIASRNAYLNNNDNNTVLENFHQDHHHHHHLQYGQEVVFKKGTVFSNPESELTCNFVSASTTNRKRKTTSSTREDYDDHDQMPHHHQHHYNYFPSTSTTKKLPKFDVNNKSVEENYRLNQSGGGGGGGASTSGRGRRSSRYHHDDDDDDDDDDDEDHAVLLVSSPLPPPPPHQHSQQYLNSSCYYLLHQNDDDDDEIDALIRLQNETLRSVVEQTQCRLLMSVLEQQQQQLQRRLKEKQIELENAWGRNAQLQENVKQMSSVNQMWFNVAKNNEAMVLSLRSTLEQHLLNLNQNTAMGLVQGAKLLVEEGFGDSSDGVADDAHSSNNNNCHDQLLQVNVGERYKTGSRRSNVDVRDHDDDDDASMMMKQQQQQQQQQLHRKMCKVCNEMEVSVLLLPCRHLCLCKDCEAKLQACPICNSFKNASLQIFMS